MIQIASAGQSGNRIKLGAAVQPSNCSLVVRVQFDNVMRRTDSGRQGDARREQTSFMIITSAGDYHVPRTVLWPARLKNIRPFDRIEALDQLMADV